METTACYVIDVINTFQRLTGAVEELQKRICQQEGDWPAWFTRDDQTFYDRAAREAVVSFISQYEYTDNQEPREIILGPGLVPASQETLDCAEHVNLCKQDFKAAMLALKAAHIQLSHPDLSAFFIEQCTQRTQGIQRSLEKVGLVRLHLKQCYRLLPVLSQQPSRISWTWANTRAITRITKAEALIRLQRQRLDLGIQLQLDKLNQLSDHEYLAVVQELAPHLRANIVNSDRTRKMIKGAVPIFYPASRQGVLPQFIPPKAKTGKSSRSRRNDTKLSATPFLPAIRAHRYVLSEESS